jgi:lipoic acid synthetase
MSNATKQRSQEKLARIPIKVVQLKPEEQLKKPSWIKTKYPTDDSKFLAVKALIEKNNLHTVCQEASCPNVTECFSRGTATFMIMGDVCTRRCPFCDVGHGKPNPLDPQEPKNLADAVKVLGLNFVVITSVDRDDLRDGGASHFVECVKEIRALDANIGIEILVPDFRGRMDAALEILSAADGLPNVFNHNIETAPRLYKAQRPGSDYQHSLTLLKRFKVAVPHVATKSGIMVGLGETFEEVKEVMRDLRQHDVDIITIGQYLQPSQYHSPVLRYLTPEEFDDLRAYAHEIGFKQASIGAMVRSSYHADEYAEI